MTKSIKRTRVLVSAVAATAALFALTATSASAAPVPAWWTNPGAITMSGTLTLKLAGGSEKTCTTATNTIGEAINAESGGKKEGGLFAWTNGFSPFGYVYMNCTGSTRLQMLTSGVASYETNYRIKTEALSGWETSPYGTWTQYSWTLPFTNASGGSSSFVSFANTPIGICAGGTITATGTLTVKRSTGANLTLTH
jgi:hypothetical protein